MDKKLEKLLEEKILEAKYNYNPQAIGTHKEIYGDYGYQFTLADILMAVGYCNEVYLDKIHYHSEMWVIFEIKGMAERNFTGYLEWNLGKTLYDQSNETLKKLGEIITGVKDGDKIEEIEAKLKQIKERNKSEDDQFITTEKKIKQWVFWNGRLTGKECLELINYIKDKSHLNGDQGSNCPG
jgi:hypothetical protein